MHLLRQTTMESPFSKRYQSVNCYDSESQCYGDLLYGVFYYEVKNPPARSSGNSDAKFVDTSVPFPEEYTRVNAEETKTGLLDAVPCMQIKREHGSTHAVYMAPACKVQLALNVIMPKDVHVHVSVTDVNETEPYGVLESGREYSFKFYLDPAENDTEITYEFNNVKGVTFLEVVIRSDVA